MIEMSIAQHTYTPEFSNDMSTLILNDVFKTESCADYAARHNFNVLFKCTTGTSTGQALAIFLQKNFRVTLSEKKSVAPDGTLLTPDVHFLLIHPSNEKTGEKNE